MGQFVNLCGMRFGRLTVVDRLPAVKHKKVKWNCLCDCGRTSVSSACSLTLGITQSCGCLRRERLKEANTTHGQAGVKSRTSEYRTWAGMIQRCTNEDDDAWDNYGGRGIRVCRRWEFSFENFFADMGKKPSRKYSIDRIDNDGDYCLENCRWATRAEQNGNTRKNTILTIDGSQVHLAEAARRLGFKEATLRKRIARFGLQKAIELPMMKTPRVNRVITRNGQSMSIAAWAKETGIKASCIVSRIKLGWSEERALTFPVKERHRHASTNP